MSVPVTIPDTAAYEEHVFANGEVDFVVGFIRQGDYLFGTTLAGNKMMRLDRNNLATNSVLDFGGGPAHIRQWDMAYVPGSSAALDRIYVIAAGDTQLVISSVNPNPTPMTFTDVITEAGGQGQASITSDGTYLYAIRYPNIDSQDTIIYRYTLDGSFTKTTLTLTGYRAPKSIRAHGGFVYVTGFQLPGLSGFSFSWLAKVNATTFLPDTITTFKRGSDPGATVNDLAITPMHVWVRYSQGKIRKCPISDITSFTIIDTGFASDCTAVAPDGAYCWVVFENGKAVRINTSTDEQRVYTLNPGQNYFGNIALDNKNIYAVRHEAGTVVSKYAIDTEPGAWQWDIQSSAALFSSEYGNGVASDSNGNVFFHGVFNGIYLAKYSPAGVLLWSRGFSTNGNAHGIAVDASGDVYIIGEYLGQGNFGGPPIDGFLSGFSIYVCKYSGVDGTWRWSRGFSSNSFQLSNYGINIAIGSDGHPIITGQIANATFDSGSTIPGTGVYLVKLSTADGAPIWYKAFGAGRGQGIGVDSAGNIWITGHFLQTINFGGSTFTSEGYGMFIAKFNSSGDHQYSFGTGNFAHVNGEYPCGGHGLAIDPTVGVHQNDIALAIGFSGSINIGGNTHTKLPNDATPYMLLARFDSNGNWLWDTVVPGGFQNGYGAAVDLNGNMLFAGINSGGNFGQGVVQGATFIAKYNQEGTLLWVKTYSTAQPARSIAATPAGNMAITGAYSNPVDFGGGERTPTGRVDLWVLQLGP